MKVFPDALFSLLPQTHLARKFLALMVAVALCVLGLNLVRELLAADESHQAHLNVKLAEQAKAKANDIAKFVTNIENQARATLLPLRPGPVWHEANELAALRLFREAPAVRTVYRIEAPHERCNAAFSQLGDFPECSKELNKWEDRETFLSQSQSAVKRRFTWQRGPERKEKGSKARQEKVEYQLKEPYLDVALRDTSHELGVSMIKVNLRLLWDEVRKFKIGDGGQAYLIDKDGRMLANKDMDRVLLQDEPSAPLIAQAARAEYKKSKGASGWLGVQPGLDKKTVVAAYARVPLADLDWLVLVELPAGEAYAAYREAWWRAVLLASLSFAFALGISFQLTKWISGPLEKLRYGVERFIENDFAHRIEVQTRDELGALAQQFNVMAKHIEDAHDKSERMVKERTAELNQRVHELHALHEVSDKVNATLDDWDKLLQNILEKAVEFAGADAGTIYELDERSRRFRSVKAQGMDPELADALAERQAEMPFSDAVVPDLPPSFIWEAAHSRHTLQITDISPKHKGSISELLHRAGFRALLIVPLVRGTRVFGAFVVRRRTAGPFSQKVVDLVETLASQSTLALQNAKLLREVRDQKGELENAIEWAEALLPQDLMKTVREQGFDDLVKPQRREVTIVFFDLRGFTGVTRKLEPEETFAALKDYHGAIGPLIFEQGGTLERFTGDAILVIFNGLVPAERPAERAVRLATAARDAAQALHEKWRSRGYEQLGIGIAIDQDYATCGLVGFEGRRDFAAIGNVTNRCSRLCGAAKAGQILATGRVVAAVGDLVDARPHTIEPPLREFPDIRAFEIAAMRAAPHVRRDGDGHQPAEPAACDPGQSAA